jgi:predicted DNA binding CopG/RHH family protein
MRGIVKDKSIRFRLSEPEVIKFKKVAMENGLSLSGFARYSMTKAARMIKQNKDEVAL